MTEIIEMVFTGRTNTGYDFTAGWQPDSVDTNLIEWYGRNSAGTVVAQGYGEKAPKSWPAMQKLIARIGDQVELVVMAASLGIHWEQQGERYMRGVYYRYHCELRDIRKPGTRQHVIIGNISLPDDSTCLPMHDFKSWEEGRLWMAAAIASHKAGRPISNRWEGPVVGGGKMYEPPAE